MILGGDRLAIAQAAVAATVGRDLGTPLVDPEPDGTIADESFLALAGGFAAIGQPIASELLGLERLMRKSEAAAAGESTGGGETMTDVDVNLDAATARLQNKILNPALPFQVVAPPISDLRTIDSAYGAAVQSATVAGQLGDLPPPAQDAWDLLFDDGKPSEALERYRDYEAQIDEVAAELDSLSEGASQEERQRLQGRLDRLETEWIGLGKKREIERAFEAVRSAQADASFEDERAEVLQRFESGKRLRSDLPGQAYFESHVLPVDALFSEPGSDPRWKIAVLGRDEVIERIDSRVRRAFDLGPGEVERGTEDLAELRFEYLVADIIRDWLDPDFFRARYWKFGPDAEPLSDGAGGGTLPCVPTRVVFVREVEYSIAGYGVAGGREAGASEEESEPKRHRVMFTEMPTVMNEATLQAAKKAGLSSAVNMLQKETAARAAPTTLKISAAQFKAMPEKPTKAKRAAADVESSATLADDPSVKKAALSEAINRKFAIAGVASKVAKAGAGKRGRQLAKLKKRVAERVRPRRRKRPRGKRPGPKVRDHRGRPKRKRRARAEHHERRAARVVGTITMDEKDGVLPELVVSYAKHAPEVGPETTVVLNRQSPTLARFELDLSSRPSGSRTTVDAYTIRLRLATDEILAQVTIELDSDGDTHEVEWRVIPEPTGIVVAAEIPFVHGYVVRGVPACPNPDPELPWE